MYLFGEVVFEEYGIEYFDIGVVVCFVCVYIFVVWIVDLFGMVDYLVEVGLVVIGIEYYENDELFVVCVVVV